jgi:hypothetical protein
LRRSRQEGGIVKNVTLGNLSHLPDELVEIIRAALQGYDFRTAQPGVRSNALAFAGCGRNRPLTMQRLGFAAAIRNVVSSCK